jgi:RNA polymerase sigma-70 factor (ECF subfamily)
MSTTKLLPTELSSSGLAEDLNGLLAASARADRKAFRRLYDLTHRKLFSVALLLLKRRDAAEDALQEAYLRVWTRAGTFDPSKGEALAWLARIVRNIALDRLRLERKAPEDLGVQIDVVAVEPVPVFELHELQKRLLSLAPKQRQAILMTHFEGFSREEVAKRLQVPIGTIKSWVFRSSELIKRTVEA